VQVRVPGVLQSPVGAEIRVIPAGVPFCWSVMLVSTAELAARLHDPSWVIFDCRHDLLDPAKGERLYREGHVPGAFFAPVDTALSGAKRGTNGRHPLPDPDAFAAFLSRHGISDTTRAVAYDDVGGQYAARLWWLARWIGHRGVALLDGGWPKWLAEGRETTTVAPAGRTGGLRARPDATQLWTAGDVQRRIGEPASLLVDARAPERFRGEIEPIDPVAGHVPGAVNRFFKANLRDDLTFRPATELRREFEGLLAGRDPANAGHQCGSGITACVNLFAMEYAGLAGSKLYAGSWSEWIADPARPVARGRE
jgi:thiosulfate/3-mercaptopyruvate sulfurtransferase